MAFCKVCACGEKVVFERRLGFPDTCPMCGRKMVDFLTYNEDDPQVNELVKKNESVDDIESSNEPLTDENVICENKYVLRLENGNEIDIPNEGCIVGRAEVGAEVLADCLSVSRQHIRIMPRKNVGIIVEDLSRFGTIIDGHRLVKNTPIRVICGAKIVLCNVAMELLVKGKSD